MNEFNSHRTFSSRFWWLTRQCKHWSGRYASHRDEGPGSHALRHIQATCEDDYYTQMFGGALAYMPLFRGLAIKPRLVPDDIPPPWAKRSTR